MAGSSSKHLVHRVFSPRNSMSFVAIKMSRRQSGPRRTGARWGGFVRNFFRIRPITGDLRPVSFREEHHYAGPPIQFSYLLYGVFQDMSISGSVTSTLGF